MMKFYSYYFYVFIAIVYIMARFCLVANYEIGEEEKRVIHFHVLPQPLAIQHTHTTGEKLTACCIRRFSNRERQFSLKMETGTVIPDPDFLLTCETYSGIYVDPPPLRC